jgi:hypothetical protein
VSQQSTADRQRRRIELCAGRIANLAERDRFSRMLTRADELAAQSKELRILAWARYRTLTGLAKGEKPYA